MWNNGSTKKNKTMALKADHFIQMKLSAEQVSMIRNLRLVGWTQGRLAEKFKVTQSTISYILSGRSWGHLK